jgi:hypothetical protein
MSSQISLTNYAGLSSSDKEHGHRMRLYLATGAAIGLVLALTVFGFDYYRLGAADRPFSPKHALLKPSGQIGINLGIFGVVLFLIIFLYPLRKRIKWLQFGVSRHWLDFHVIAGLTAPVVIAFHSSFKFRGIAGMAFWIMTAVALSGIIGRYVYAQIPRSLNSAELSLKELDALEQGLTAELAGQKLLSASDLRPLLRMPSAEQVKHMPAYLALLRMLLLDLARPFQVARLRTRVLSWRGALLCLGGILPSPHREVEQVIETARRKCRLSKRIAFLSHSQRVFHLWHVIHRPFSYSFAVLALIHIGVVIALGFF